MNKSIPEGKILLTQAKVKNAPSDLSDDLDQLIKQKPRERLFNFDYPLIWVYLKLDRKKQTWGVQTVKKIFGQEPVYLDSNLIYESSKQMFDFLSNKGYFRPLVNYRVYYKKKMSTVWYMITPGERMMIDEYNCFIPDRRIDSLVNHYHSYSLIPKGVFYDSDYLIYERERIARILNDNGFYKFSKYYIFYDVDTSMLTEKKVNINLQLRNLNDTSVHKVYFFDEIYFKPFHNVLDTSKVDTILYKGSKFIGNQFYIKPDMIIDRLEFNKGDPFSLTKVKNTINNYNELDIYKFIDIDFKDKSNPSLDTAYVDCVVKLTPMKRQEYSIEFEANTTEETKAITSENNRYFGVAGSLSLKNRNIFNRAVLWTIRFGGNVDVQSSAFKGEEGKNSYQTELSTALYFPKAIFFESWAQKSNLVSAKTALSLSQIMENNVDFSRNAMNLSYLYSFNNSKIQHFFTPVELSRVRTEVKDSVYKILIANDILLASAFETHIITGFKYGFVFKSQKEQSLNNLRVKLNLIESAGNIPRIANVLKEGNKLISDTTVYQIFGVSFYQFFKTDADISFTRKISEWSNIAGHFFAGIGVPYGNTTVLPFEKRYFIGGANSLRAWPLRGLGPGYYHDTSDIRFERTGEIKLETSVEYRFDIISILKGAIFIDAGNIWTLNDETERSGGQFKFNDFYRSTALGTGLGLRFDLSYFILRTDFGIPLYDPQKTPDYRWTIKFLRLSDIQFNFGIGYPF